MKLHLRLQFTFTFTFTFTRNKPLFLLENPALKHPVQMQDKYIVAS